MSEIEHFVLTRLDAEIERLHQELGRQVRGDFQTVVLPILKRIDRLCARRAQLACQLQDKEAACARYEADRQAEAEGAK